MVLAGLLSAFFSNLQVEKKGKNGEWRGRGGGITFLPGFRLQVMLEMTNSFVM
jgi:hypothetical protein